MINHYTRDSAHELQQYKCLIKNTMLVNSEEAIIYMIEGRIVLGVVATFYKKNVIKKIKFDNKLAYGEDILFKYLIFRHAKNNILLLPIRKYHYICRANSAVNSYSVDKKLGALNAIESVMKLETNDKIKKKIFDKMYIPRLIGYSILGIKEKSIGSDKLRGKIKKNILKILFRRKISILLKMKTIIILMPKFINTNCIKFLSILKRLKNE